MVKYKKKLSALLAFSLVWSASIRTDITASEIVDETKKESKITTQKLLPEKETIQYAISEDDIPELVEDALLNSCEEKTKANAIELENAVREYKEEAINNIKKDNSIIWDNNSVTINQVVYKGNSNVKLVY